MGCWGCPVLCQEAPPNIVPVQIRHKTYELFFHLEGPESHRGRRSPKNGEKLQNSPLRGDPRKWGKITEKLQKLYSRSNSTPFWGRFSPFSGVGPGRGILYFFPIFQGFPPRWLPGPSKGKNNSQHKTLSERHRNPLSSKQETRLF